VYFIFFSDGGAPTLPNVVGPGVTYPLYPTLSTRLTACVELQSLWETTLCWSWTLAFLHAVWSAHPSDSWTSCLFCSDLHFYFCHSFYFTMLFRFGSAIPSVLFPLTLNLTLRMLTLPLTLILNPNLNPDVSTVARICTMDFRKKRTFGMVDLQNCARASTVISIHCQQFI